MGARGAGAAAIGGDPQRPSPITCPHAPRCVGCPYYGSPYGEQLARKRRRVEEALAAAAPSLRVVVAPPVHAVRLFGYRNQVKLVARRAGARLLLGVYAPGTHQVVDVSRCPVHDPLVARALEAVQRTIERETVPIYDERSREGWLRYVAVRSTWMRRTTQVTAVVRDRRWPGERRFVERLRRSRGVGSVVLNVNDTTGNTIFGATFIAAAGDERVIERVGGWQLIYRPGSFMQANLGAARRAYVRVVELAAAGAGDVVVDLYSGVGAIALSLAASAKFVLGIEASPSAVRDAVENTRLNGVHNARFRAGAVAETLRELRAELPHADVVTLNPPRKGAGAEVIAAIAAMSPRRVVYMSCDPDSLAADLEHLAAAGYRTDIVYPFDFLPQTDHVECIAVAER